VQILNQHNPDISSLNHRTTDLQVHGRERISSILRRVTREWALVPEDWRLCHVFRRLEEDRIIDHYKQIKPNTILNLERKRKANPMARTTQTPSPESKHQLSSESHLTSLVPSPVTSTNPSDLASPPTLPAPPTDPSPSLESLDAKTSALKKLNDASKELEIATIRKRDVMLFVLEAQDRVQRAEEELGRAEVDDGQATRRIDVAEQAMRSACKTMDMAMGSGKA